MAGIIDGVWREDHVINPCTADAIENWITVDGSAGPTGRDGFKAEVGRYQLYLAHGCPSCHAVAIARRYFGLQSVFALAYVDDIKRHDGWRLSRGADPVFGADSLHAMMITAEGPLTARATVPQLVDKKTKRLVTDSSDDMVRMMDQIRGLNQPVAKTLWPVGQAAEIDELSHKIQTEISSGVYEVLFAKEATERASLRETVRNAISELDQRLKGVDYLHGAHVTASDLWLFPTLVRFDSVYSQIFCLDFKLCPFRNITAYLSRLSTIAAFAGAADLKRIETHYFQSVIHGPYGPVEPGLEKTEASS